MIAMFQLCGTVAVFSGLATYLGMKFVEWWECRKRGRT